jgi:hypothetical protein
VLDDWFGRRTDLDVVIKLHTGGGKTLVALLMAQSVMNELGEPVIYLAPTNQLVDQVIAKSQEYGIPTVRYVRGQTLANEFFDGEAVLGAYETLFNGRSKFGVRNSGQGVVKAGTIILDDAHVALSSVRDAFSLTIEAAKHPEVYADLQAVSVLLSARSGAADRSPTSRAARTTGLSRLRAGLGSKSFRRLRATLPPESTPLTPMCGRSCVTTCRSATACSAVAQ